MLPKSERNTGPYSPVLLEEPYRLGVPPDGHTSRTWLGKLIARSWAAHM